MRTRLKLALLRLFQLIAILVSVQSLLDILPTRSAPTRDTFLTSRNERIFIASIHWNNEVILRSHWVDAVVALCKELGPENVFVSVQESGSWDDSKGALRLLKQHLQEARIPNKIILDETTHRDEISKVPASSGWIETPRGRTELRRIPYLARLRNLVLEPLHELHRGGQRFDKILWLNDVVFTTQDVYRLLNTRNGDYAAACSLDFATPPKTYDTFALRDFDGHDLLMQKWPFFRARASRKAVKANKPVPVVSCWNGITVFNASPFYASTHPLKFRGISDDLASFHLEGSECCLVHADNPLSAQKGVWLNPNVRVAYNAQAYAIVNPLLQGRAWIGAGQRLKWSWENRLRRWFTSHLFKELIVWKRLRTWQSSRATNLEVGTACIINEMQVLVENGWAHV